MIKPCLSRLAQNVFLVTLAHLDDLVFELPRLLVGREGWVDQADGFHRRGAYRTDLDVRLLRSLIRK